MTEGSKYKGNNIYIKYIPGPTIIKAATDFYKAFVGVMNGKYHPLYQNWFWKPPKGKNSNTNASTIVGINE